MKKMLVTGLLAAAGLGVIASDLVAEPAPQQIYPEEWIDALKIAAEENPNDASTRLRLGAMLSEMGRLEEAGVYLAEAYEINPSQTNDIFFGSRSAPLEDAGTQSEDRGGETFPRAGADVIVGALPGTWLYSDPGTPDLRAYGLATTSCNAGDEDLLWEASTDQHPVIAQHLYRLVTDPATGVTRMEQIGQSWVKHGFFALTESLCAPTFGYNCNGVGNQILGVGCSDPYGATLNASYTWLGPKHEINATTGAFQMPWTQFPNQAPLGKRLQVRVGDMDIPNAKFFAEGHYISAQDAADGNDNNNASYRRVFVDADGLPGFERPGGGFDTYQISMDAQYMTVPEQSAIFAWQAEDPTVTLVELDDPDGGRFILGYDVTDLGDGTWHYEYALYNMNSDRSAQAITIPNGGNVAITDLGYHDVDWHSGAPYTNIPWSSAVNPADVTWATQTYAENEFANALRWGTTYNFRFVADTPPTEGSVDVTLFKPGTGSAIAFNAMVPSAGVSPCPGDLTGDDLISPADLSALLGAWGSSDPLFDLDESGVVGPSDLSLLLGAWGPCP
jgi:hypothetical protein